MNIPRKPLTAIEAGIQLATASRILAAQSVVDGYGHVSIRDPGDPSRFLISRSMAPALVTPDDIMMMDLDGNPIDDSRQPFLERFIHGAIYALRSDVDAVVHSHSASVIPFGVVETVPLRAIYHMGAFLGPKAPVFEIRETAGPASDMLIRDINLGRALAASLGGGSTILMRGHGSVVVGSDLPTAVYRAVYTEINARIQIQALQLGPVNYLTPEEAEAVTDMSAGQVMRAWDLWQSQL